MKIFKDRVAVVPGAASGIGRGMAEIFIEAGMKVVLADIYCIVSNLTQIHIYDISNTATRNSYKFSLDFPFLKISGGHKNEVPKLPFREF